MTSVDHLIQNLKAGDRRALAQVITLVESTLPADRITADVILTKIVPRRTNTITIGISGAPGVGKSTFIDAFGTLAAKKYPRLAVLAVDPTSPVSGGSILGDKTRMETLTTITSVFIRPSPSGEGQGGVGRRTRESILLCESAGFDFTIVETVGVGQAEISVASMVDVLIVLQGPNAGDELQGIKRGVLEVADMIVITKADGDALMAAERAKREHDNAMHLTRSNREWMPPVILTSAVSGEGLNKVLVDIERFVDHQKISGEFSARRKSQTIQWFDQEFTYALRDWFFADTERRSRHDKMRQQSANEAVPASVAARTIFTDLI